MIPLRDSVQAQRWPVVTWISGVLGAYAVLFPRARVYTLVPFVLGMTVASLLRATRRERRRWRPEYAPW
jgi:hypothetical protein